MQQERQTWLVWLLVGLIVTALLGGFAFYRPFETSLQAAAPSIEPPPPKPELNTLPGQRQTFLVMGVDPDGEFGRADSMVVVSFDPGAQRLAMLSIPRDTWTLIPGHGYDKINHAYAYGGHELATDTVERLLGIEINHWATLSFDGFMKVIDAVGGVQIDVAKHLYYVDPVDERMGENGLVIDIQPGLQRMDGATALKYARFRADEEGDVGRVRRQQEVIAALMKRGTNPAIVAKIPQLIPALASTVGTDLSVAEMLKLAATGREALGKPPVTGATGGEGMILDGIFYLVTDLVETRTTAYQVLVGQPPDEAFLQKAREEQKAYSAALKEASGNSVAAADPGDEAAPKTGTGESTTGASKSPAPKPPAPAEKPTAKPAERIITVAVIDATGKDIYKGYVQKLRSAGFRVARISRSPKVLKSTVVIDHAQQPQVEDRLKAIFPHLYYASAPDPKAQEALEIILGQDLLDH